MSALGVGRPNVVLPLILAASAFLAACGGGGGGTSAGGAAPPIVTPTATPTLTPTTTQVSGKLVDDPSGAPLGGVKVGLAPWTGGATPMPEGTTAPDGTFSFSAPNGHYLLVIGSDSTSDTTRPTIHDNVTLTGGNQTLKAPVLPAIPLITPPAAETNGNYRLTTLDATAEVPCYTAFNGQRASYSLASVVEDEWLTENTREWAQAHQSPGYTAGMTAPSNPFGFLTTSDTSAVGGVSCPASTVAPAFAYNNATLDSKRPTILWFGGTYLPFTNTASGFGLIEYPQDPRSFTDPNVPNWP